MKPLKITLITIGVLLLASLTIYTIFQYRQNNQPNQPIKITHEFRSEKIVFQYPLEYQEQSIPVQKVNQSETLIKLKINKPLSFIEFAKEKGAIIGANITKSNFLDTLEKNAEKSFPVAYPQYQKIKSERTKISGYDASIFNFSYLGNDKQTTIYMYYFLIPLGNDAYYLTVQSVDQSKLETDTNILKETLKVI